MRFLKLARALLCFVFMAMIGTGSAGAPNLAWFCDVVGFHTLANLIRLYGSQYIIPCILLIVVVIFITLVLLSIIEFTRTKKLRLNKPVQQGLQYHLQITHKTGTPYEISEIGTDQVKSLVKIGIKNIGNATLTDCRVQIEKMVPPHPVSFYDKPIVVGDMVRVLRPDDPELLIIIAVFYTESKKYRFATPVGGLMTPNEWIDGNQERRLFIKACSNETCQSLVFKLFLDSNEMLRLQHLSDAS